MSFAINPNPPRSQGVVSHNLGEERVISHSFSEEHVSTHDFSSKDEAYLEKSSEDDETLQEREEKVEAEVSNLARQLTRQSTRFSTKGVLTNPFVNDDLESTINPASPNFRARDWIKMLLEVRSQDPAKYPDRKAGVSFRNLGVHGFGSPTDYQKDVLNSLLEVGSLVRRLAGGKRNKLQILRDFDGLVKNGEMLVVLGRPGSGCSTFLKTIAGEMGGINISEGSQLNYRGMSFPPF
jgi:ATP-binding cassette, subfamily G (WHITE), member 2, PDR